MFLGKALNSLQKNFVKRDANDYSEDDSELDFVAEYGL